jgi:hypothetical protein
MPNFLWGTDPEFFLSENGKLVSAVGRIAGTKDLPTWLSSGAGLQYDNVALEFCTPVSTGTGDMIESLKETFRIIKSMIPSKLVCASSAYFPESELQTEEAKQFGCSPDFDAWTMSVNQVSESVDKTFRSAGGHVHVGHTEGSPFTFLLDIPGKIATVKAMDILLGLSSLSLDNTKESKERRMLYGKAGCHRPKVYGLEYRTLSNFWLKSPIMVRLIHSLTHDALCLVESGGLDRAIQKLGSSFIVESINNPNIEQNIGVFRDKIDLYMSEESKMLYDVAITSQFKSLEEEWAV